jgi:hypothetical protein
MMQFYGGKAVMVDFFRIVVKVPPPMGEAFIATPFSDEFRRLLSVIKEVLGQAGLKAYTLSASSRPNMMQECFEHLRQAELLIAVCSPEAATGITNSNVMYELGFGFCIGKPYIILTDNVESLPFDIRQCQAFVYEKQDIDSDAFRNRLLANIYSCRAQVFHRLVHASFSDTISVFDSTQWFFAEPVLCSHFLAMLTFACEVQDNFSLLNRNHLSPLIYTYSRGPSLALQEQRLGLLRQLILFPNLSESQARAEDSLAVFQQRAPSGELSLCKGYITAIRKPMSEWKEKCEAVQTMTGPSAGDELSVTACYELQRIASALETNAIGLFKNLLSMIKEAKEHV